MQCLNEYLASYLERVRSLEADNQKLESKIWDTWRKRDAAQSLEALFQDH